MNKSVEMIASMPDCVVFSVWVDGSRYDCPVPRALLYELGRNQDPHMDRIDAYLALKEKIRALVEQTLEAGASEEERFMH